MNFQLNLGKSAAKFSRDGSSSANAHYMAICMHKSNLAAYKLAEALPGLRHRRAIDL